MSVWVRIAARYLIGALVGLLAYWNIPDDIIQMVREDSELFTAITLFLAGVVEYLTVFARKKGWLT